MQAARGGAGADVVEVSMHQSCFASTANADTVPLLGSEVAAAGAVVVQNASETVGGEKQATLGEGAGNLIGATFRQSEVCHSAKVAATKEEKRD